MAGLWAFYIFLLGGICGSFLNVVIYRLPLGRSVVRPRSACPQCEKVIPWYDNVPILSWVWLRARSRCCGNPIPVRYPAVELLTALCFLATFRTHGPTWATFAGLIMISGLIAITFIDIDIWEIPDEISLSGIVVGAVLRPIAFDVAWYDGLVGALLGAAFLGFIRLAYQVIKKVEGMGLGDVKLLAMIGAFVGPVQLAPAVLVASVSGTIVGLIVIMRAKSQKPSGSETATSPEPPPEDPLPEPTASAEVDEADSEDGWVPPENAIPFGPFLSMGGYASYLFGREILGLFVGI